MRLLLCDDEPLFLEKIYNYCLRFKMEYNLPLSIVKFSSGNEVLEFCQELPDIDIFILDIKMNDLNGLSLAKKIRSLGYKSKIIFLTVALEFAPQGYELDVSRYWIKPLSYNKFCSELLILIEQLKQNTNKYIVEHRGTIIEKLYFDDIVYIETQGRKTCVHLNNTMYLSTTKLSEYEKLLDNRFFRCHAAYIVNMDYIQKIQDHEILLTIGDIIYVSKGKKSRFVKELYNYIT